jgi:hypothetical protein
VKALDEIEEMKTYYPTVEEFSKSPIDYFEKLFKEGAA